MTEALLLMTEHVFTTVNLLRLFALPFADNAASARVLEKAGFVREATLRSSSVKYRAAPRPGALCQDQHRMAGRRMITNH